jgi:hypothetical protein
MSNAPDLSFLAVEDAPSITDDVTESREQPKPTVPHTNPRSERVKEMLHMDSRSNDARQEQKEANKPPLPPRKKGQFVKPLTDMYTSLGMMLYPIDSHCATVIMENAEKCAESLDQLAYENKAIRRVIVNIMQTSAIGTVLIAHAPILIAVAMHHAPGMAETAMGSVASRVFQQEADTMHEAADPAQQRPDAK